MKKVANSEHSNSDSDETYDPEDGVLEQTSPDDSNPLQGTPLKKNSFPKRWIIIFGVFLTIGVMFFITKLRTNGNIPPKFPPWHPDTRPPGSEPSLSQAGQREINAGIKEKRRFAGYSAPVLNERDRALCNLLGNKDTKNCKSQYIAESLDLLYLLCPIYSFGRKYDTVLYDLHTQFQNYMKSIGIPFVTFEAIKYQSDEEYVMTKPNNEPFEMQGYYHNISYLRENFLNIAIQRLNKTVEWEYVAWIDAHQVFDNQFWWEDAIHKSEHSMMVQLFADSIRWNDKNKTTRYRAGFVQSSYLMYDLDKIDVQIEFGNAHLLSRASYEKIGYIHDECFASGCDWAYMYASLPSDVHYTLEPRWPRYNHTHQGWLNRVIPIVNGSRAYVPGKIFHLDHKSKFSYVGLRDMLERTNYKLTRDFQRDENGVFYLSNFPLAKAIENYYLKND